MYIKDFKFNQLGCVIELRLESLKEFQTFKHMIKHMK